MIKTLRFFLMLLVASTSATAVTPLSPRFAPQTQTLVLRQLGQAQVPAVGHNSVVISMLSALGFEPRATVFHYDEPYPHLPKVRVSSEIHKPGCASIAATVEGSAEAGYAEVRVSGIFCLVGTGQWSSSDFVATQAKVR